MSMMYENLVKTLRGSTPNRLLLFTAADAIEELSKQHETQRQNLIALINDRPKWIPVAERLPNIGEDVLCFCRAGIFFVLAWDGIHWHEGSDRYYMNSFVTHWIPLPKPPEDGEAW